MSYRPAVTEFPNELELLTTREFDAGRAHMSKTDGYEDSLNKLEDYLRSLLGQ